MGTSYISIKKFFPTIVFIRFSYPTRILGNFLTTHYSFLRLICYKLYCSIPFLYEMRVLMDWMFIPTSLSLTYYFMMEEIARNAWIQKCWGVLDAKTPIKRAQNRGRCERCRNFELRVFKKEKIDRDFRLCRRMDSICDHFCYLVSIDLLQVLMQNQKAHLNFFN